MVMCFASSQIHTSMVSLGANHSSISQSDYCSIATKSISKVRLSRPIVDGQGYETCNPGARIARFVTNSKTVAIHLDYTGLVTRAAPYNPTGWVLVNGVKTQSFSFAVDIGHTNPVTVNLSFPSSAYRTIEVICPMCASVDFTGVDIESTAAISPAADRPSTRLACAGDSITHGFSATDQTVSWPFLLGVSKDWETVNLGYGSRWATASDGTALANLLPDVATYLIGFNDFNNQEALATFKASYKGFINNFRAVLPSVKLYCMTPLWTNVVKAIPIESYRQQIRDALTELGNPLNILVEGTDLTIGGAGSFNADGIHPNDTGAAEIAGALTPIVTI